MLFSIIVNFRIEHQYVFVSLGAILKAQCSSVVCLKYFKEIKEQSMSFYML